MQQKGSGEFLRKTVLFFCFSFLLLFLTACNKETEQQAVENKQQDQTEENEQVEPEQEEDETELEEVMVEEDEISPYVTMNGVVTLQEDSIDVDVQSNLPEGVRVIVSAYSYPYGGYVVSINLESEDIVVGENGEIKGSIPFDPEFLETKLNEPIRIQLLFRPEGVILHDRADDIRRAYGERGENLEGPFVVEEYKSYYDKPEYRIRADDVQPARIGQEFIIEEKTFGEPPSDYGDTEIWMEAEIVDIDHRYVYVEGRTNLIEGLYLFGNVFSSEDSWYGQNMFSYDTEIQKDGTFVMPIEYKSLTDEGYLEIYTYAGSNHRRGKAAHELYGEEFERLTGDVVERRYEGKKEQKIILTIPLNPEHEEAPENVDITQDGDEMKLIMPDDILFEFGESEITSEGEQSIKEIAEWLETKEYKGTIKVYGHTDNVGSDAFNQELSENRAKNVHRSLTSYLSNESLYDFEVEGFGKREPIATNETDEGRERNRRVEILIEVEE